MSAAKQKAKELYLAYGMKKASFIAFDQMQHCSDDEDMDFWLKVINQIALLDLATMSPVQSQKDLEA